MTQLKLPESTQTMATLIMFGRKGSKTCTSNLAA